MISHFRLSGKVLSVCRLDSNNFEIRSHNHVCWNLNEQSIYRTKKEIFRFHCFIIAIRHNTANVSKLQYGTTRWRLQTRLSAVPCLPIHRRSMEKVRLHGSLNLLTSNWIGSEYLSQFIMSSTGAKSFGTGYLVYVNTPA